MRINYILKHYNLKNIFHNITVFTVFFYKKNLTDPQLLNIIVN